MLLSFFLVQDLILALVDHALEPLGAIRKQLIYALFNRVLPQSLEYSVGVGWVFHQLLDIDPHSLADLALFVVIGVMLADLLVLILNVSELSLNRDALYVLTSLRSELVLWLMLVVVLRVEMRRSWHAGLERWLIMRRRLLHLVWELLLGNHMRTLVTSHPWV